MKKSAEAKQQPPAEPDLFMKYVMHVMTVAPYVSESWSPGGRCLTHEELQQIKPIEAEAAQRAREKWESERGKPFED